jgi:hypothetical protein
MRVDPLTYAVVLPTLLVAHTVADHVAQTDHQATNKATSWSAMAGHVGSYQATQLGALLAVSRATATRLGWRGTLLGGAFSAISHAFLDRRWPVKALLRATRSPNFASPQVRVRFGVDGYGRALAATGVPTDVEASGPLPLHGVYLADQALHHGCLALAAALIAARSR